jgi:hypothetical protein
MKSVILIIHLFIASLLWSQKNCDFASQVSDSLGTYRSTKEYLIFERVFGNSEQFLYANLNNADGTPYLTLQYIQKNNQFINAQCFDENSKIYLQLENGKVVTLIHTNDETCGNFVINEEGKHVRVLVGNFFFLKNNLDELKSQPITMLRVKFGTDHRDFVIKEFLESETLKKTYRPAFYFGDYLHCVLD